MTSSTRALPPTVAAHLCQDIVDPNTPGYTSQKLSALLVIAETAHTLACAAEAVGGVLEGISQAAYSAAFKTPTDTKSANDLVTATTYAARATTVHGKNALFAALGVINDPTAAAKAQRTVTKLDNETLKGKAASWGDFPVVVTLELGVAASGSASTGDGSDVAATTASHSTTFTPRTILQVASSIAANLQTAALDPETRRTVVGSVAIGVSLSVVRFVVSSTASLILA